MAQPLYQSQEGSVPNSTQNAVDYFCHNGDNDDIASIIGDFNKIRLENNINQQQQSMTPGQEQQSIKNRTTDVIMKAINVIDSMQHQQHHPINKDKLYIQTMNNFSHLIDTMFANLGFCSRNIPTKAMNHILCQSSKEEKSLVLAYDLSC